MLGQAVVAELCLMGGKASVYITCEEAAIPAPGRYLLAHESGSNAPLSSELFAAEYRPDGFVAAPPVPGDWRPRSLLDLRGPLGNGFRLPSAARRVAVIAMDGDPIRLLPLAEAANRQKAAVALVCENPPADLPLQLEVHPSSALAEVYAWADYAAFDVQVGSLSALEEALPQRGRRIAGRTAQALVRTPMPCGGLADCGVCTVRTARGPKLACVDGPVFDLELLLRKG